MKYYIKLLTIVLAFWTSTVHSQNVDLIDHSFTAFQSGRGNTPINVQISQQNIPGYNFNALMTVTYSILDGFIANNGMFLLIRLPNPINMQLFRDVNNNLEGLVFDNQMFTYIDNPAEPNLITLRFNPISIPNDAEFNITFKIHVVSPSPATQVTIVETLTAGFSNNANQSSISYLIGDEPLPLSLNHFTATKHQHLQSKISWETKSERDIEGFEVERSQDGTNWSKIAYVNSQSKDGDMQLIYQYLLIDEHAQIGNNFYRLKIIETYLDPSYSNIQLVNFDQPTDLKIYPNPSINEINIDVAQDGNGFLYDLNGKQVLQTKIVSKHTNKINIEHLNSGMYFLKLELPDQTTTHKIIKE